MKLADRGLNVQAEACEEAQTKIRIAVRDGWLEGRSKAVINVEVQKIIRIALKDITNADLRSAAYRSLNAFAERQYNTYLREFGATPVVLLALLTAQRSISKPAAPDYTRAVNVLTKSLPSFALDTEARGVPIQQYVEDYFKREIVPAFDRILRQKALDPDDVSGTNSLRNRAEMEVRYAHHLAEIEALRAAGVKLVTCSVHADCSDRCAPYQGRVYSLDGTSGTTEDGKRYVPLEKATDIYYTTKAGKVYKNGLFGFNCRHYLITYKVGMIIPHVSKETQERESKINTRQRELERRVREYKEKALIFKKLDRDLYLRARRNAIAANKLYIQFSKDHGRAYYPSRTKLL